MSSNLFNTLEKNNYNDKRTTFVSVDSKNQKTKNNYEVELNKNFSNVMSIRLKQIQFPNSLKPINKLNNKLRIKLPNEKTYYNQGGCNTLASDSTKTFILDDKEFMIEIPEGFYTVGGLHFTDNNILKMFNFNSNNIYKHINRPDCIYITYGVNSTEFIDEPFVKYNLYKLLSNNYLPLLVNNIPSIGGISSSLINNREYYYKPYEGNTPLSPLLYNHSYLPGGKDYKGPTYSVVFPLTNNLLYPLFANNLNNIGFGVGSKLHNYLFFIELRITDLDNNPVNAKYNETLITGEFYKESVFKYESSKIKSKKFNLQQILGNFNLIKELPFFGRGYFFDFVLDKDKNDDGSLNSVLFNLGWKIDCNTIHVSDTCAYKTIHSNLDFQVKDKVNFFISSNTFVKPIFPDNYFIFQKLNNTTTFLLTRYKYIYMKIEILNHQVTGDLISPSIKNIFCKIMLDPNFNLLVNNDFTQNFNLFYNGEITNLNKIKISFVDKQNNLLELDKNHNFTLEIVESLVKLKNTHINSKSNNVNYTTPIYNLNSI